MPHDPPKQPKSYQEKSPGITCDINCPDKLEKPEGVGVEIVDSIIRMLDTLKYFGVGVEYLMSLKHEYNKTRPRKHNKEF